MVNFMGFIDDSGKIEDTDPTRGDFFGYGLLKLEETHALYNELTRLKVKADAYAWANKINFKEFKFSEVGEIMLPFYKDLIDIFFREQENYFAAIVCNKPLARQRNMDDWSSYIHFSKTLIKEHVKEGDSICIIADRFDKPLISNYIYETQIKTLSNVFNVCMIESHAALFIQLVDVILGAVRVAFQEKSKCGYKNVYRLRLSKHLRYHVGKKNASVRECGLARDFSIGRPYFFVREWK